MITQEQQKEVRDRVEALNRYLNIDEKRVQLEEEQLRTQAPGFWDDQKKAEAQMKLVKGIEKWIKDYEAVSALADELDLAVDFYKENLITEAEVDENYRKALSAVEALELRNMLRREEDQMDAVLKINSGAGGTEAQDWAQQLMRMYMRWAEENKYKCRVANLLEADDAGIKSCTLEIEGAQAYGFLKSETGVHRLVRVSPYNAQGKRMTEEEILIENTETRDQPKNKENALRLLRSMLYDKELKHRMAEQAKVEAGKMKIEWGSQIRSYVFDDRRVKDHRTGYQTSDVGGVMDGKIDAFIKAYLMEFGGE